MDSTLLGFFIEVCILIEYVIPNVRYDPTQYAIYVFSIFLMQRRETQRRKKGNVKKMIVHLYILKVQG